MKARNSILTLSLAVASLFSTGCYTQVQTLDFDAQPTRGLHSNYNNRINNDTKVMPESVAAKKSHNGIVTEKDILIAKDSTLTEQELLDQGIYYKDVETADWYEENFAGGIYWDGYDQGYEEGYADGAEQTLDEIYADLSFYSWNYFSFRNHRYPAHLYRHYYTGWRYNCDLNFIDSSCFSFFTYNNYWYDGFGWAYYSYPAWGGWYDPFYYTGWYGRGYYPHRRGGYAVIYNDYHNGNRRGADIRRDGARTTGLVSRGNGTTNNSGVTRSRSTTDASTLVAKNRGRTSNSEVGTTRTRSSETSTSRYTGRTSNTSSRTAVSNSTVRSRTSTGSTVGSSTGRTRSSGTTRTVRTSGSSRSGSSSVGSSSGSSRTRSGSTSTVRSSGSSSNRSSSSPAVRSSSTSRTRSTSTPAVRSSGSSTRSSSTPAVRSSSSSRSSTSSSGTRSSSSSSSRSRRGS